MKFQPFDLRKQLILGFVIMVCIALFVSTMLCLYEVRSRNSFYTQVSEIINIQLLENRDNHVDISQLMSVLKLRQYRIAMMIACVFLCIWTIFFIFIRNLLNPLNEILRITRKMADGHLNQTLDTKAGGEIGRIGENINDLGVNVQEILLHVWKHTTDTMRLLEQIQEKIPYPDDDSISRQIEADISQMNQSMEAMQELIQGFELYDIRLDQEKVMAGEKKT